MRTERDGLPFDSKKEAAYYERLKWEQKTGRVKWFIRQPGFDLPGEPPIRYRADFLVVLSSGQVQVVDVKGHRTREYEMKRRLVKAAYGIDIVEV